MHIIISKCKKILLCSETDWCDWAYEVSVDKLIRLFCFLLRHPIVVFCGFCSFITITDMFIVNVMDVLIVEMFL